MKKERKTWVIRNPEFSDFPEMQSICTRVYTFTNPWNTEQLTSHLRLFKKGQLVAVDPDSNKVIGFALSLIVNWDDYDTKSSWKDFTDSGYFTNHDPENGRTLYGAEVMVDPNYRGLGVGRALYEARRQLTKELKLLRIRAGARMRGYATYAKDLSPEEYMLKVVRKEIFDPTISFQLKEGFKVLAVVPQYLKGDPESMGYAAVIEWLNPNVAQQENYDRQKEYFIKTFGELL